MLKIAAHEPMPSANDSIDANAKAGRAAKLRTA
jgi:hypothetical protein